MVVDGNQSGTDEGVDPKSDNHSTNAQAAQVGLWLRPHQATGDCPEGLKQGRTAVQYQRAGSIPAMWRRLVRRECGSIPHDVFRVKLTTRG